jgi:hypothetical protein
MAARPTLTRVTGELPQIIRIVIAALVSWQLAQWALDDGGAHPPLYAAIVPLVAMRDEPYSALNVSADRLLGVLAGVGVGLAVVNLLGVTLPAVGIVIGVGLLIGTLLRLGPALNLQCALSGLLVFTNADPAFYGVSRLWETGLGAGVTVLMSAVIFPANARRHFEGELHAAADELGDVLRRCAELVAASRTAPPEPDQVADLLAAAHRVEATARELPKTLETALTAVTRNPLRRRDRAPLEALRPQAALAADVGRIVAVLVDEALDLAGRPDLRPTWPGSAQPLPTILLGIVGVIRARLSPGAAHDTDELQPVVAEVRAWQRDDQARSTAVLRRPVHRLLVRLGADVLPVVDVD